MKDASVGAFGPTKMSIKYQSDITARILYYREQAVNSLAQAQFQNGISQINGDKILSP
jgi:hypothetical protein